VRVLLIPTSFPPVLGGLQTVTHTLAQGLSQQGHEVLVVTNRYPRTLPSREVLNNVLVRRWLFLTPRFYDIRRGRLDIFLAALYAFPSTRSRMLSLAQTFLPEIINVHFPDAQLPFVLWLRRYFRFRLVVSLHGHEVERWFCTGQTPDVEAHTSTTTQPGAALARLRQALQEADAVTACSRSLLDKAAVLEPAVAQKGSVIYNGIDPARFTDKTSYPHPRPYVLAFGRLAYTKGFDMLLDAFARVAPAYQEVDLILVGEGGERQALQAQVQQNQLSSRVHFFGRATPQELTRLLNGCGFVAVPSRQESFGIAALEALAAGKPVLATGVGGLAEIVQGPGTELVQPSISSIEAGMARWLSNMCAGRLRAPTLRLEDHSWDRVVAQFERVYLESSSI
jgi:glycogen(starch) synthase